ncbi:MAG TPA: hypothetical protein VHV77_10110, partial [Pirellulales bacterium]|nr:hypothetical protein [Pirellulales bacterium]
MSFAVVMACYCVYAFAAVPLIEPEIELPEVPSGSGDVAPNYVERQKLWLKSLFLAGDWELTSPKILETAECILLVKSYKNLPDGRMELRPCTAIFLPEAVGMSVEEQRRQAIVMRASEGAILQFDSASDLRQARIGKVIGGRLIGPVTIRSDYKEPGPHDDILVHTSDVDLDEKRVWTARPIDFQLGPNRGRGRRMQIDLVSAGESGFRGMRSLELSQEVEVRLEPGDADMFPGNRPPSEPRAGSRKAQPPVEVRCRGPFRFNFETDVATFHDQVDVTRMHATGPSDQLTCEMLSLVFKKAEMSASTPAASSTPQLQPTRVEATGNPVIVRAPSNDFQGRGQRLVYDIATGGATFSGTQEVLLRQGHREIRARQVYARPDDSGQLSEFRALGVGQVRGTTPDGPDQAFEAQWTRSLHFRPYDGQPVLSVDGNAIVNLTGQGTLKADEIHVWFNELPPEASAPPSSASNGSLPTGNLQPDRMLAIGRVVIDSPQMTGAVAQLQAWFEPLVPPPQRSQYVKASNTRPSTSPARSVEELPSPAPPPLPLTAPMNAFSHSSANAKSPRSVRAPQPSTPVATASPPGQGTFELPPPTSAPIPSSTITFPPARPRAQTASTPPRSRFHFEGEQLRMRLRLLDRQTELAEAIIDQRVLLRETAADRPTDKPMLITGDQLHLVSDRTGDEVVRVGGRPAYVEARGLTLSSEAIHLDRPRNLLFTDAQGVMTLPADKGIDGMPAEPGSPLEITWQGVMTFDGLVAKFERQVVAHRPNQQLYTDLLDAVFTKPISFRESLDKPNDSPQSSSERASADIQRIVCRNGVWLENRTVQEGRLDSIDRLQMAEMTVETNGDMMGIGPGVVMSWRVGSGDDMPGQGGGAGAKPQASGPPDEAKDPGLTYLNATFQRQMHGNMKRHEMHFEGQVRT